MAAKVSVHGSQVWYWCPGCKNNHMVTMPRWTFNGDFEKPTISPSVNYYDPATQCHHFVRDGKIEFLSDCFHELKGTVVPMEDSWRYMK
jgi:hypothetical protein